MTNDLTLDDFLGGRIALYQHRRGYRVTMDSVLLAAGVPARTEEKVLDMGCGSGAAALCLAARVEDIHVTGLELQPAMLDLARRNVAYNNLGNRVRIVGGDVSDPPVDITGGSFDHVMANPPYIAQGEGTLPPDPVKAAARVESHAALTDWVVLAATVLRSEGTLTLVHRAERQQEILGLMRRDFGRVTVYPLWPGPGHTRPYSHILVQGVKDETGKATTGKATTGEAGTGNGLVIHTDDGGYTGESEAVLRHGGPLIIA